MDLSSLKPAKGAVTRKKNRVGRGEGSKKGGTSTRGQKGAGSRSGNSKKIGFEGGQMPLQRRVPKFGFKNHSRVAYVAVNLSTLQELIEKHKITKIDLDTYKTYGLASKSDKVKILAKGELSSKIDVVAHAFSKAAKEAIEKNGGQALNA